MDLINERTTYFVTVTFKDEDGTLVVPSAAFYSLYCETTGTEILAEGAFPTPLASSKEIEVTYVQNKIQVSTNAKEQKLMTVRFTYDSGASQGTAEYRWVVQNLGRIS